MTLKDRGPLAIGEDIDSLTRKNKKLIVLLQRAMKYVDNDECFSCNQWPDCAPDCELAAALRGGS